MADQGAQLHPEAEIPGNFRILRCRIEPDGAAAASSVIVKQVPLDEPASRNRFLNEVASLKFMAEISGPVDFAPGLIAYDLDAGVLIMEDLGARPELMDVLNGSDRVAARLGIVAYGRLFGQIHAASAGQEARFRELQAELGAASPGCDSNMKLVELRDGLEQVLQAAEISVGADFWAEYEQVATSVDQPERRVFLHCDSGPQNVLLPETGAVLLDFEFGDYRQAGMDLAGLRNGFQQSMRGRRVPAILAAAAEAAYQTEIVKVLPELSDDLLFDDMLLTAQAHWALGRASYLWPSLEQRLAKGPSYDQGLIETHQVSQSDLDQRRLHFLLLLSSLENEAELLPAVQRVLQHLDDYLRGLWGLLDEAHPYFAAFR
jgi:hypothetical protein